MSANRKRKQPARPGRSPTGAPGRSAPRQRLHKVLQDAGREAERSAAALLKRGDRAERVGQVVDGARLLALKVIQSSPQADRHACRAGCAFCCHTAVTVSPPEAFAIVCYVQEHCTPDEQERIRVRLEQNAALAVAMTRAKYIAELVPCALLTDDGRCFAHPVRPLACAGFVSTSMRRCEAEFRREPDRQPVPTDEFAAAASVCVAIGLRDACRDAGLEGTAVELHHALLRILDTPDAAVRWSRGEPILAGCPT